MNQDVDIWINHFKALFEPPVNNDSETRENQHRLKELQNIDKHLQNPKDLHITQLELKSKLCTLKNEKACKPNAIFSEVFNEMSVVIKPTSWKNCLKHYMHNRILQIYTDLQHRLKIISFLLPPKNK